MNEQSQKLVEEMLRYLQQGLFTAGDELPNVLNEYLAWCAWAHSLGLLIGVCILALTAWGVLTILRRARRDPLTPAGLLGSIGGLLGVVVTFHNAYSLIQLLAAPRVYLIESIRSLLK